MKYEKTLQNIQSGDVEKINLVKKKLMYKGYVSRVSKRCVEFFYSYDEDALCETKTEYLKDLKKLEKIIIREKDSSAFFDNCLLLFKIKERAYNGQDEQSDNMSIFSEMKKRLENLQVSSPKVVLSIKDKLTKKAPKKFISMIE